MIDHISKCSAIQEAMENFVFPDEIEFNLTLRTALKDLKQNRKYTTLKNATLDGAVDVIFP